MLIKLNSILLYSLVAFFLSLLIYPSYIALLKRRKAWKQIRDESVTWDKASIFKSLHAHKAWTPTMWWWVILLVVLMLVVWSLIVQSSWLINNSLFTREETYIILFAFFSMWWLWLLDDYVNIRWKTAVKGLTARMKFIRMFLFSGFISYWFYWKLWIDYINLRPLYGERHIGLFAPLFMFFFTVIVVNAINITDGLDGLVWWLSVIILSVLAIMTFLSQWYLATTVIWIVLWSLLAFLRFNINPASIFMWDSGALALWGLISALLYLINIRFWIFIPFLILLAIFWIEFGSSFLQILSKKYLKKKLFAVAPFHHLLEHQGQKEHTIVMKFRVIQWILGAIALICLLYQI